MLNIDHPAADGLICFSHLRWAFVFQRPQHLMTRFSRQLPVLYFEEAIEGGDCDPHVDMSRDEIFNVWIAVPVLPDKLEGAARNAALGALLDDCLDRLTISKPILWFYTPMMLPFTGHLEASLIVYDCMDELANFDFAPASLRQLEAQLLAKTDLVFTGGRSLFNAKRDHHPNTYFFPSSIDVEHFGQARHPQRDQADQEGLPHPRLGFFGVVDERFDSALISAMARARPEWSIIVLGPIVKIDPASLPQEENVHYLGAKPYRTLPAFLAGWDVALMPFAANDATRFISPTKTPEYLAGGKPVVSTAVPDVVAQYGDLETMAIATDAASFVEACEHMLTLKATDRLDFHATDNLLKTMSWDATFSEMGALIAQAISRKKPARSPHPRRRAFDAIVVGAGFAGAVMAERLASVGGQRVLVIDKRDHIAGNAYDYHDAFGIQVHAYGPHIFHTNSPEIVDYLSRFTEWRPYEHRVLAQIGARQVPIPINRRTLNEVFDLSLSSDADAARYLETKAEPRSSIRTSEDVVLSAVGRELYEMFFRGYTRKQWGLDPSELDRSVTARIPTRTSLDDRYFTDSFQAMPRDGYTAMFGRMLDHPNIEVELGVDYAHLRPAVQADLTVYTGPIDEFYGYRYGALPYRSLRFVHETLDQEVYQAVGTVNFPEERTPYTRVSEFKHLTGQSHSKTSVVFEYPTDSGAPYYPIPQSKSEAIYQKYKKLADREAEVVFVGRLATYRYYNMDQVIGQALATYRRLASRSAVNESKSTAIAAQ